MFSSSIIQKTRHMFKIVISYISYELLSSDFMKLSYALILVCLFIAVSSLL